MTTVLTYTRVKSLYPDKLDYIVNKIREFESINLIRGGQDLTKEQIILFVDNLEFTVENSIITDRYEYIEKFDDIIYHTLIAISKMKGCDFREHTSDECLEEIRNAIIDITENYHVHLAPPLKEYQLGDKIQTTCNKQATIIYIPSDGKYGLLFDDYEIDYTVSGDINDLILYLKNESVLAEE